MKRACRNSTGGSSNLEIKVGIFPLLASASTGISSTSEKPKNESRYLECKEMKSSEVLMADCLPKDISSADPKLVHNEGDKIDDLIEEPSSDYVYQTLSASHCNEVEVAKGQEDMEIDVERSEHPGSLSQSIVSSPSSCYHPNSESDEKIVEIGRDHVHILYQSSPETDSTHSQSHRKYYEFNHIIMPFLKSFGLKEENIRQTVVRKFKSCMKKVRKFTNIYKNDSPKKSKKIAMKIMKLYFIENDSTNRIFLRNEIRDVRNLINQVKSDTFEANYGKEKSCNDKYVRDLFSDQMVRELYRLHHSLAAQGQGQIYFENFGQLKKSGPLKRDDEEKVISFCENFLDIYT